MTDQIEMPDEFTAPRGAGPQLRYARERLGLSVADIAARTRISQRQIEDLEAGNFAAFSSRTYAIGFARTVAKAVGLDGEAIARQVRGELNVLQLPERMAAGYETSDPARVPSRSLVWLSLVAVALLLAGLFVAYRTLFSPAAELPSLVDQQEAERAAAAASAARDSAAATPAAPSGPVVFTSLEDGIWVRFYDASGTRLLETEMARGQSFTVPAAATGPMLWTARPEALTITVGGRAVPPLATEMMTMRDVQVDAASLLARPAPAASPSGAASASPTPRNMAAPLRQVPLSQSLSATTRRAAPASAPRRAASNAAAPSASQDAANDNVPAAAALAEAQPAEPAAEAAPPPADGAAATGTE
ncbi:MAG: helix-turn-helix domain-containing protein [Pseudomonadota bacterium]